MYLRDPAGNLVEINWPDVTTLDRSVVTHIEKVPGKPDAIFRYARLRGFALSFRLHRYA